MVMCKYVLVLVDDLSGYVSLRPAKSLCKTNFVASELVSWCSAFGAPGDDVGERQRPTFQEEGCAEKGGEGVASRASLSRGEPCVDNWHGETDDVGDPA